MKNKVYIGIDPDVDASGVARLAGDGIECSTLPFAALLEYILENRDAHFVIESSWTTGHVWHGKGNKGKAHSARLGYDVGRNHEVGRKIAEFLDYHNIDYTLQPPFVKCWKGRDRKITHGEIAEITGWDARKSNQEERDALLLAWVCSGRPVRITSVRNGRQGHSR